MYGWGIVEMSSGMRIDCGCGLSVRNTETCPTMRADCGGAVLPPSSSIVSSIPWWGWVGGGLAAFLLLKGGR